MHLFASFRVRMLPRAWLLRSSSSLGLLLATALLLSIVCLDAATPFCFYCNCSSVLFPRTQTDISHKASTNLHRKKSLLRSLPRKVCRSKHETHVPKFTEGAAWPAALRKGPRKLEQCPSKFGNNYASIDPRERKTGHSTSSRHQRPKTSPAPSAPQHPAVNLATKRPHTHTHNHTVTNSTYASAPKQHLH